MEMFSCRAAAAFFDCGGMVKGFKHLSAFVLHKYPSSCGCRQNGWCVKCLSGRNPPSTNGLSLNRMVRESLSRTNFPSTKGWRQIGWCLMRQTFHPCRGFIQVRWRASFKTPNQAPSTYGLQLKPMEHMPKKARTGPIHIWPTAKTDGAHAQKRMNSPIHIWSSAKLDGAAQTEAAQTGPSQPEAAEQLNQKQARLPQKP